MTENVNTETVEQAAEAPGRDHRNGVTRPKAGTQTARVWEIADRHSESLGEQAPRKMVLETAMEEGLNPSTVATQYGKWCRYYGLVKRPAKAEVAQDEGAEQDSETVVE